MAVYKVPQDVEADDKLIGPFSFRQFIYLIIVAGALTIAWFLSRLFLPLIIIPLPVIIFFGALALPLRKDQPMETYLAALISFYLKPRRRLWNPDGTQTLVEITAPTVVEVQRTKDLSEDEARERLSYLANIVDSRGWAVRGVAGQAPTPDSSMNSDMYYEAQQAEDILDSTATVGTAFGSRLEQTNAKYHEEVLARARQQATAPAQASTGQAPLPASDPLQTATSQPAADDTSTHLTFNPYPTMHQAVVEPVSHMTPPQKPEEKSTSVESVSADIINLANNPDLSVETIAREANRIHEKEKVSEDEVVISLR